MNCMSPPSCLTMPLFSCGYARYYYQNDPQRLSATPLMIHALLHIADSILDAGPVWVAWAFPMEQYCGSLQPAIRNRRFPYASLNRYILDKARLDQIKLRYGPVVSRQLKLQPPPVVRSGTSIEGCKLFLAYFLPRDSTLSSQIPPVYSSHHVASPHLHAEHRTSLSVHSVHALTLPPQLPCDARCLRRSTSGQRFAFSQMRIPCEQQTSTMKHRMAEMPALSGCVIVFTVYAV